MSFDWTAIISFSIFIAGIIALFRFRKIQTAYYPFLFCIWIACCNEIANYFLIRQGGSNHLNNNIYALVEACLITALFRNLKVIKNRKLYFLLQGSFFLVWLLTNFLLGNVKIVTGYFYIYYGFVIALLSISLINELVFSARTSLLKNASFLLALGFLMFFSGQVMVYGFWLYGLNSGSNFLHKVFQIIIYINLVSNLIYSFAVLCMPQKLRFTLPFSLE
jgi:hypothetical protein